jgi:hypothetical protein
MSDRQLQRLVKAATRAAAKMKIEYDEQVFAHHNGEVVTSPTECWTECELLWQALRPYTDRVPS